MKKHHFAAPTDFREFVFTATGRDVDPAKVSAIDLYDNLLVELDRLHALAALVESTKDELDVRVVGGVAMLLKDIERRGRAMLEAFDRNRSRTRDKP